MMIDTGLIHNSQILAGTLSCVLFILSSQPCLADNHDLQQKIEEIRTQIAQEAEVRDQLWDDLNSLDENIEVLKSRLQELEEKISKQQRQ